MMGLLQYLFVSQVLWIGSQAIPRPPNITEARVLSPTSVTVSWTVINNVDYELSYMRARGYKQKGDCKTYLHADTLFLNSRTNTFTLEGLEEFSTYLVSVASVDSTGRSEQSKLVEFDTLSAAPSSPPTSVTVAANSSTTVVVTWSPIPCIDRNSVITEYKILVTPGSSEVIVPSGTIFGELQHLLYGLTPKQTYSIQVAAVNRHGFTGPASNSYYVDMPYPESMHIQFKGKVIPNHGLVSREEVGEEREGLFCLTTYNYCCQPYYRYTQDFLGEWYYPNGTALSNRAAGASMYRGRAQNMVRLLQRSVLSIYDDPNVRGVNGIYHCVIPTNDYGQNVTLYVGLYEEHTGMLEITHLDFTLLSEKDNMKVVFELNCITSGGPVEHSNWTRNHGSIPPGSYTNKTVQDTQNAVYHNKLTVSGRYLGLYSCNFMINYTDILYNQVSIEAANSPTNFTTDLEGYSDILVTWVAPESGDTVTGYVLYLNEANGMDKTTVEINSSSLGHRFHNLHYGSTYYIHLVALSKHLPSPRVGPMKITTGIPDPVVSLNVFPDVTSINVTWDPPIEPHGIVERYDVKYWILSSGRNESQSKFVTDSETVLTSLLPETTYIISVRPYTYVGGGDPTKIKTTTLKLYIVKDIEIEVVTATTLRVSWSPVEIPFWNLTHYTLYYSAFSNVLEKVIDSKSIQVESEGVPPTMYVIHIEELSNDTEHMFEVTANLAVQGITFESNRSLTTVFSFDTVPFQLQFSPVEYCTSWSRNKSLEMEEAIHNGIVKATRRYCNCSFPVNLIRNGVFRCWNLPTEVTYRSEIVGTPIYKASGIVSYIEEWVKTKPALLLPSERLELKVETKCPVRLTALTDPECPSVHSALNETLSLVSSDTRVINCMKKCIGDVSSNSCTP